MAKTVLIVDDNALIRQTLCEIFRRESDFQVCGEAENGKEAIEKAWELHPDLIVLDLSMPVMNGLEAAPVLKCLMPNVTLIMYTAFADSFAKREVLPKGISELVSKSESFDVLLRKARGVLHPRAA
jgi:DNA-binding NarL/FixJ family response regulator